MDWSFSSNAVSLIGSEASIFINNSSVDSGDGQPDVNTSDSGIDFGTTFNNNLSLTNTDTSFSAEEQIIQQRGRRMSKKKALHELFQVEQKQQQQHYTRLISSRELFMKIKQSSMNSPDSKSQQLQSSPRNNGNALQPTASDSNVRRKSLLRTPVKRRLRRNVDILSKLRKSGKRRRG